MVPHPWRRFGTDWPGVEVRFVNWLGQRWEETRWEPDGPVVYMNGRIQQVKRRAAITHACEHLDRGAPCDAMRARDEMRVVNATARWLLPDLDLVADTLAVYPLSHAAHELWVPKRILIERLNGLTDDESEYVHSRRESA